MVVTMHRTESYKLLTVIGEIGNGLLCVRPSPNCFIGSERSETRLDNSNYLPPQKSLGVRRITVVDRPTTRTGRAHKWAPRSTDNIASRYCRVAENHWQASDHLHIAHLSVNSSYFIYTVCTTSSTRRCLALRSAGISLHETILWAQLTSVQAIPRRAQQ